MTKFNLFSALLVTLIVCNTFTIYCQAAHPASFFRDLIRELGIRKPKNNKFYHRASPEYENYQTRFYVLELVDENETPLREKRWQKDVESNDIKYI